MVAYTLCAGCMTGDHEQHTYWIQKPPEGVMGGFACGCKSADECAGNGEKLLRAVFGDKAIDDQSTRRDGADRDVETLAALLVGHDAWDDEDGLHCDCDWMSEAWTHGETRADYASHLARAILASDWLAAQKRQACAAALREAAEALGSGPTLRVLVERESCDWWTDTPVKVWLRARADRLEARG